MNDKINVKPDTIYLDDLLVDIANGEYKIPIFQREFVWEYSQMIELFDSQLNTTISIDFIRGSLAHRQQFGGGRGQAISKAMGLKSGITPSILDTTAGLAGDAFVLATLGCPIDPCSGILSQGSTSVETTQ